jgi:hypothetical protein
MVFHLLLVMLAGWINRHQEQLIAYLLRKTIFSTMRQK